MPEFKIYTDGNPEPKIEELSCSKIYTMPFFENGGRLHLHDDPDNKNPIIGGYDLKQRYILETPLPIITNPRACSWRKLEKLLGENHAKIENFMHAQSVMLDIKEKVFKILRDECIETRSDKKRGEHKEFLRKKIDELKITDLLHQQNLHASKAEGNLEFAYAGLAVGFAGKLCGLVIHEDQNGNHFIVDSQERL